MTRVVHVIISKMLLLFVLLLAAFCHASEGFDTTKYTKDILFSIDQDIQRLSLAQQHRFDSTSVKNMAQASFITQAWQDVFDPETAVCFPGKFSKHEWFRKQQIEAWDNGMVYVWKHSENYPSITYFFGYSMLKPMSLRLHSVVFVRASSLASLPGMEWCEKPFWRDASICRMRSKLRTKAPGFLLSRCDFQAREEGRLLSLRAAYAKFEASLLQYVIVNPDGLMCKR